MGLITKQDAVIILVGVTVALFIIFIAVITQLSHPVDMHDNYVHPDEAYKYMQTGDILTVSYNSIRGQMVKICTGSVWTHSGLIVESDGHKFVVEVANYKNDVSGVVVKPLEDWFDWNKSRLLGWRPYRGEEFPHQEMLNLIKRDTERTITPDMNSFNWLKTLVKRKYTVTDYCDRDKYYCSEYITHILQECNVVEKNYLPDGYKPWELLYGDMPFIGSHTYGNFYLIGDSSQGDAELTTRPSEKKSKKFSELSASAIPARWNPRKHRGSGRV